MEEKSHQSTKFSFWNLLTYAKFIVGLILLFLPIIISTSILFHNFYMSNDFKQLWLSKPHTAYFFILCGVIGAYLLGTIKK